MTAKIEMISIPMAEYERLEAAREENGRLRADNEHLATVYTRARADMTELRRENERLRAVLEPSAETKAAYIGEFSFSIPDIDPETGDDYRRTVDVPWTTIKEIMAAIRKRAALASPSPRESEPDVDAATGCADDQSGMGAAVAILGRERVNQIMDGAIESEPATDWRKLGQLAIDYVCASDEVGNSQDEYSMSNASSRMDDAYHALTDAVRSACNDMRFYEMRSVHDLVNSKIDAVRAERQREKGPDHDAS